jgi:glycosyltransferase involved in cell wall biosynthesis
VDAEKPRVFFVNRYFHPDESATSQLISDLLFELAATGFEVHVVCSRQLYGQPAARLPAHEIVRNVRVHRVLTTRFGRHRLLGRGVDYLTFYAACAVALMRNLQRGDIAIAMTDPPLISIVAAAAAQLRHAILVNWLQDVFPEVATELGASPLPAFFNDALRRLRDASLRAATVNVALGSRMAEFLRGRGLDTRKIRVIANWAVAEQSVPKSTAESALRAQLELNQRFVVEYSGNLGRAHECETILEAGERLRADPDIVFLMIGAGANMDVLQSRVKERRLPNFRFLPYQSRLTLSDSMAAADLHLVNLRPAMEGLIVPSKFYGILAAGRPVIFIGDRDGELSRIIREARCGLVVEAGRPDDLVAAIRGLQRDSTKRSAMAQSARQLLDDRYSAAFAHRRWHELLTCIRPLSQGVT